MFKYQKPRSAWSWAFYDWANSAFATTIMAGFFPVFFKQFWSAGTDPAHSTAHLGFANGISAALIAMMSPVLGTFADKLNGRKKFLLLFASLGIVSTGALYFVAKGEAELAAIIYAVAILGFSSSNSFYDSMIVDVSNENESNRLSALGFSLGYLGGGLLFALNVFMTIKPQLFGLASAAEAVQVSFISVSIWWALFSLPLIFWVHETPKPKTDASLITITKLSFQELMHTFLAIRKMKVVGLFLLAYFFYIDGVNTIMKMAVDYGLSLGFDSKQLIAALLLTQFVAFPAALAFGKLADSAGEKFSILLGISVYAVITIWGYFMHEAWEFWVLATLIGLVQGGVQAVSRSYFAKIIPRDQSGEFFGFYNMLGKASSVMGPTLMATVSLITANNRAAILSVLILFFIGAVFLIQVPNQPKVTMNR